MRLRNLRNVIALTMLLGGTVVATAPACRGDDAWPVHTVKIIVPFAAGGSADAVVGGGAFANARDDHTLLYGTASMLTVNPLLQDSMSRDGS